MKRTTKELREEQKLYIFRNAHGSIKIGISLKVNKRRRNIETASGIDLEIVKVYNTISPALQVEQLIHKSLDHFRLEHGEWFDPVVLEMLDEEIITAEFRAAGIKQIEYAYKGLQLVPVDVMPLSFENSLYSAWNIDELEYRAILKGITEECPQLGRFFKKFLSS